MTSDRWEHCAVYWGDSPELVFYGMQGEQAVAIGDGRKKSSPGDRGKTYARLGAEGWEVLQAAYPVGSCQNAPTGGEHLLRVWAIANRFRERYPEEAGKAPR
jgi:hypothetical protein